MQCKLKNVEFHNQLERQILEHKDTQFGKFINDYKKKLSWTHVCANEAFTTKDAIQHSSFLEMTIAGNRSVDWRKLNLGKEKLFTIASKSPTVTIQDIFDETIAENAPSQWNFVEVSKSPGIQIKDVENHPDLPWCYNSMSLNPNLTEEFVERHLDESWNYTQLSGHYNISFAFLQKHTLPYDNWLVSGNGNMTIDLIVQYIKWGHIFDPNGLSLNPNLTWDAIQRINQHQRMAWNMYVVSKHIPLTEAIVDDNFDTLREGILHNPTLTKTSIMKHLSKIKSIYKHKYWLSKHPSMRYADLIAAEVFEPSGWSLNPNLTFTDIYDDPSIPWNWEHVSKNTFSANYSVSRNIIARQHMAAYQIQTKLCKLVFWNPQYKFCRKRLHDQFKIPM